MGRIKAANGAFSEIYNKDVWALDSAEWTAEQAGYEPLESCYARFVALLQDFMRHNRVRSVVEFGCGFWSYARAIDWSGIEYDGFDIVDGPVRWNRDHHGAANIRFHLPAADFLISKDVCLVTGLPESAAAGGAIVRYVDA